MMYDQQPDPEVTYTITLSNGTIKTNQNLNEVRKHLKNMGMDPESIDSSIIVLLRQRLLMAGSDVIHQEVLQR